MAEEPKASIAVDSERSWIEFRVPGLAARRLTLEELLRRSDGESAAARSDLLLWASFWQQDFALRHTMDAERREAERWNERTKQLARVEELLLVLQRELRVLVDRSAQATPDPEQGMAAAKEMLQSLMGDLMPADFRTKLNGS